MSESHQPGDNHSDGQTVSSRKKWTIVIVLIALFYGSFTYLGGFVGNGHEQAVTVVIPPGAGFRGSVELLDEANVLRSTVGFYQLALTSGNAKKFKAGEYLIPARATAWDIIHMLVSGKVVLHRFTAPEGWTVGEILTVLDAMPELMGVLPNDIEEGALLPETYQFTRGDSRASLTKKMQEALRETLRKEWDARDPVVPLRDAREALIMASLVEEETGVAGERARIAAVFYNRMKIGMKLQTDPTVLYGLGRSARTDRRGLSAKDLASDTPYNTYVIDGLPPGPIACPGKAAIHAVLHPLQTDEFFFVADGKGGHRFAKTLAEHNTNVQAYRKSLKSTSNP